MSCVRFISVPLTTLTVLFGTGLPVLAGASDPPGRIGSVSYLQGPVSFRADSTPDWSGALVNDVVTSGDALWTDVGARAEVHVGSSAVRLAPETLADFVEVGDAGTQIRLTQGSLYLRIRQLTGGETYEVDTPTGTVALLEPGHYRIDVAPDGSRSTLTVRDGDAQVSAADGARVTVWPGESASVSGGGVVTATVAADDWERWCAARDRSEDASLALRYISPGFVGFEALDGYGTWDVDASLGPIWFPTVAAEWAPYRFGHWGWVEPWGWTWFDDTPWGFVSSHYGRWAFVSSRWGWVPGTIVPAPVYAPALVAFVGGSGFDLSLSIGAGGGVGWFPLAPGEFFVPGYRVSPVYIRSVNATAVKVTNIDFTRIDVTRSRYANRAIPGALTVVSRSTFLGGAPVARAVARVSPRDLAGASVIGMSAPTGLRPVRASGPALSVARPPARTLTRAVVTRPALARERSAAPAVRPVPARAPERTAAAVDHWAGPADAALRREWQTERDQAFARQAAERAALERQQHVELSAPPAGISPDAMRQRQEQEREALDRRHETEREAVDRHYRDRG